MASRTRPVNPKPANRGPAAAAENRAAILKAARRLFAEQGYDVPLSTIAREAGVGQGVMYRHFPSRVDLALEVFEDNFLAIEAIVTDTTVDAKTSTAQQNTTGANHSVHPDAIYRLWDWLLAKAVEDAAFIETMRAAREEIPGYDGAARLQTHLAIALDAARRTKQTKKDIGNLQPEDLVYAWRMAYGLVVTSRPEETTPELLCESFSLQAVRRLFNR